MSKIRCAVIGVGYLGRFHAQKYKLLPNAELIGVCDLNQKALEGVSQELGVPGYSDFRELFGKVDAVSIAATTNKHFDIAKAFLEQGIHVLIEKPITETITQAEELIQLARENQVKLQVGHLERFNSARLALDEYLDNPLFIQSERLAPFNPRGADVNVILDIMIHDIDLIQNIVKCPIASIQAQGTPVITDAIDIANVHITFTNQCVANLTASRVSFKTERKTRIFQPNSYLSIDYQNKKFAVFKKGNGELFPGIPDIIRDEKEFEKGDALFEEIKSFIKCIEENSTPLVSGEDGCLALETAETITKLIQNNLIERHAKI
ncbi:Gfo/Idh/MocA family oxidoreductase [Fluoribacter dumoffii]|uniref:Gfo/Idh/MocA family protein n=1 Tax=Fluoribacter dumoffii TaxID=463 RepID=UPI0022442681|nr:Gfo/Idh/MocA family oxidoreductase [Fluoribacter dumoffii]MCW8418847.1 Gfo/Idh/MocA family oxidoreductase [Fluoribacter dumoffii]MCW8453309.1 Gfo/Idh/MocA family oxidoreductase [Fluoribacter dumoffii]MCW8459470.1 Gfo/Idh/MocA family oxidoreductase [Fluoribacter dumoffii]MCW8482830.1 Gfo/Idh/MocA family oxidoreductase [Fluoribacter dumoffii]